MPIHPTTPLDDPVALLSDLIAIPSVNPTLVPNGTGESAIVDHCTAWLAARGFRVERLEEHPGRPSLVAVAAGRGGGRSLMLNGHVDTVSNHDYLGDPLRPEIRDGNIYGRGAFDMKGGIAAMMVAAARAAGTGTLAGDVILALVADEEHGSRGTEEVLRHYTADAAIVTEPSHLDIIVAHKGFAWFDVDIHGIAAHGSRADLGIDAIAKAGHFLVALDGYDKRLAHHTHPLLGNGTIHASVISGGEEPSTYPAHCRITLERRTIPGETLATVERELRDVLDTIAASVPDFRYDLTPGLHREPFEADPESPILQSLTRQGQVVLGHPLTQRSEQYWTDAALLSQAGIPSLLVGVDGGGAHANTEWATTASLHQLTDILTATIAEFCS